MHRKEQICPPVGKAHSSISARKKTPLIYYVFMIFNPACMCSAPAMIFKHNLVILISGQGRSSDKGGSSQQHLNSKDFQE